LLSTNTSTRTAGSSQAIQPSLSLPTPKAQDLWSNALHTLPQDKRQIICSICSAQTAQRPFSESVKELVSLTRTKQQECEENSYKFHFQGKKIILRDVAEKIVSWLDKFKQVGDAAANFDPVHASLPWAGVRFLLQVP
jgi:ankyrin repeat domain-containing protein 50